MTGHQHATTIRTKELGSEARTLGMETPAGGSINLPHAGNVEKHTSQFVAKVMNLCNPVERVNTVEDKNIVRSSPPPEFRELFDQSESTFSDTEKLELMCLLWEFFDIFLKKGDELKCTDMQEFKINLKEDAKPFKARPYRSN